MIVSKTPAEIEKMAAAGAVHARTMQVVAGLVREGVSTRELDDAAERYIRSQGAIPTFKGYRGFPGSICASPNDMVVHGIPGPYRLQRGDVLAVDIGVTLDGWVSDGACTFAVGPVSPLAETLLAATEAALFDAVAQARPGNRIGDISNAVQSRVEGEGLSVVRSLIGHGVGREMHEDPQVPNYGEPGRGPLLEPGLVIAIEPMVTTGRHEVVTASDGWAIHSRDGSLAAHFEFTVAVTPEGPRILNPWHELLREAA